MILGRWFELYRILEHRISIFPVFYRLEYSWYHRRMWWFVLDRRWVDPIAVPSFARYGIGVPWNRVPWNDQHRWLICFINEKIDLGNTRHEYISFWSRNRLNVMTLNQFLRLDRLHNILCFERRNIKSSMIN